MRLIALSLFLLLLPVRVQAQVGIASFYGDKHQGRKTASGELYDKNQLTAAHKTLPFGTRVKVTNLANGKFVLVKINDRGPFIKGRIIDLSVRAAKLIKVNGIAKVNVEVTTKEIPNEETENSI